MIDSGVCFLGFLESLTGLKKSFWHKLEYKYSNSMPSTKDLIKEYVIIINRWLINIPSKQILPVSPRVAINTIGTWKDAQHR